jgi:hypothetical protein
MADDIVGIRSLKLFELLGSTMVAVVQADALAAKSTLEYIETVGFEPPPEGAEGAGETVIAGDLRMARFRYLKRDENDEVAEFVAEVPVLSLVPVPALQVETAKFSLAVKIDDVVKTDTAPAPAATAAAAAAPITAQPRSRILEGLRPTETQLVARPAASSSARSQETRSTHHLEIEVTLTQADVTVGMEKIFQLMDNAIVDRKAPSQ